MSSIPDDTRDIFLIIYHSPLFKAHWSVFVPSRGSTTIGTRIHVTGSLRSGFEHEIVRRYDVDATGRGHSILPLGTVAADALHPTTPVDSQGSSTASNRLEEIALETPAPGPSLRSAKSDAKKRIEVQDCQYWTRQYVSALVTAELLSPAALQVLETAPQH